MLGTCPLIGLPNMLAQNLDTESFHLSVCFQVVLVVKNPPANAEDVKRLLSPGREDHLEEGMATYSSILVWRVPMDRGPW